MARIVKDPEVRRNEILDAAERLIATKGYEQMSIRDIIDELQIAKGTVYHYFDSKLTLLEALVERTGEQIEQDILPIIQDRSLGALDKLRRYLAVVDRSKLAHKPLMLAFMRAWYDDENAIFRHKLYHAGVKHSVPWLSQIIRQGIAEGVFTTPYPDQAARMIVSLRNDAGDAMAELLLAEKPQPPDVSQVAQIAAATMDALERILGAPPGCLQQDWQQGLERWQISPQ